MDYLRERPQLTDSQSKPPVVHGDLICKSREAAYSRYFSA